MPFKCMLCELSPTCIKSNSYYINLRCVKPPPIDINTLYKELKEKSKKVSVVGLGYVGLPVALEFARYYSVIGFDINKSKVDAMQAGIDPSDEIDFADFKDVDVCFTSDAGQLKQAHFHIIAVPTDIDDQRIPDLTPLKKASTTIGRVLKKGDYVIYESTVYPGCTEEECVPVLEKYSGLKAGKDFKIGYSPERINPGDKVRKLPDILKIVSGCDGEALEEITKIYSEVITAGLYQAPNMKVAEAAKVIENTQRDLNISLMNELCIIFDKVGINTTDVLEAAATKWNFLKFRPGLVGGHCISIDPYYLLYKAQQLGYDPEVIAAGRKVNDFMPRYIAKKLVQMLIAKGKNPGNCRVLVEGVTFKENVSDIRNSKVVDLIKELVSFHIDVDVTDPHANEDVLGREYGIHLSDKKGEAYDAVIIAVAHDEYRVYGDGYFEKKLTPDGILFDLKGIHRGQKKYDYWSM